MVLHKKVENKNRYLQKIRLNNQKTDKPKLFILDNGLIGLSITSIGTLAFLDHGPYSQRYIFFITLE